MRKVLLLGAVVAMSLVFAFSAFAQATDGVACSKCLKNCKLGELPCLEADEQEDVQCDPLSIKWECFQFPVCNCPDTEDYFKAGEFVGVRMHILTPGVYWASAPPDPEDGLELRAYKNLDDACDSSIPDDDVRTGAFTNILYFPDMTCDPDDAWEGDDDEFDFDECTWNEDDYPKMKSLSMDNSQTLFQIPNPATDPTAEDWRGFSYWSVEIPDIRIDVQEILALNLQNTKVKIKIEFVRPGTGGICQGACQVICECEIEVATICPTNTGTDSGGGCVYFPYVITQYRNWATGVAISNLDTVAPAKMKAEFKLYDNTGKVFKYTINEGQFTSTCWSAVLDNILDKFDGTPAPGHAWLRVDTNFLVDGYTFVTDGIFGGSTLGRICGAGDAAF